MSEENYTNSPSSVLDAVLLVLQFNKHSSVELFDIISEKKWFVDFKYSDLRKVFVNSPLLFCHVNNKYSLSDKGEEAVLKVCWY